MAELARDAATTLADFPLLTCGAIATSSFKPGGTDDSRRHLELTLYGLRTG